MCRCPDQCDRSPHTTAVARCRSPAKGMRRSPYFGAKRHRPSGSSYGQPFRQYGQAYSSGSPLYSSGRPLYSESATPQHLQMKRPLARIAQHYPFRILTDQLPDLPAAVARLGLDSHPPSDLQREPPQPGL